jgi:hypothetical protein
MKLLDQPARAVLRLPGQTAIAWAVFDPQWYSARYPESAPQNASAEQVLAYYFEHGQALGHSPNLLFDEAWHLRHHPVIAAGVRGGQFASAFDAYCRGGGDRSPHWLFEEGPYRRRNPDLTDEGLRDNGLANGYDHFLRHGSGEGRVGHPMFDGTFYLAQFDPEDRGEPASVGPFRHYLQRLAERRPELPTTPFFSPEWSCARCPRAARAIAAERGGGAWQH